MIIAKKLMLHVCFLGFFFDGGVLVIYNCRKNPQPISFRAPKSASNNEKVPAMPRHSSVSSQLTDGVNLG